jgi:hypothetical protein
VRGRYGRSLTPDDFELQSQETYVKKLLATLTVLIAISTPAFSQSFCTCDGTGNVLPFSHKGTDPQNDRTALRQGALRAFAAAPGAGSIADSNAPAATGGGSVGYNEMLRHF